MIYADWELDSTVDDELLVQVDRAWNSNDQSFCSSADRHRANVLSLSFDVDAGTYEDAARRAREVVVALASDLELSGRLIALEAYTEAGWLDASPTE